MIQQNFDGLYRYDDRGERFYARVANGKVIWYPSVTRIIKATSPTPAGLLAWYAKHGVQEATKLRDEAAERGTQMHVLIEEYLINGRLELDGLPEFHQKALASFAQFCRDHEILPVHTEKVLYSDEYQYAGACDLICLMTWKKQRIHAMIDFKSGTSLYDDYVVQLGMYWHAAQEHGHIIDRVFNWSPKDWRKEPTYTLTDQTEDAASARIEQIEPRCKLFRAQNDYKPKARMVISGMLPDEVQIRTVDPDEVILEAYQKTQAATAPQPIESPQTGMASPSSDGA